MNYMAVRSVSMRTLNRQRANLVFSSILQTERCLTPQQVSAKERIFEIDGVLRGDDTKVVGHCQIGSPLSSLLEHTTAVRHTTTGSFIDVGVDMSQLLQMFAEEKYVLWYDLKSRTAIIVLKKDATPLAQLRAWCHALLVAKTVPKEDKLQSTILVVVAEALTKVSNLFEKHTSALLESGWDLSTSALETYSGCRIVCEGP